MSQPVATLRLHGYPVSNYHNIVRAVLLEKGAPHEVVLTGAAKDPDFIARSPMGKIPFLETADGDIAETVAIIEYLEDILPSPALLPTDPFARAKVRQVINIMQCYVEGTARTLYPGVFMNGENSANTEQAAQAMLERAIAALRHLVKPAPFLMGDTLSLADIFAFYCFELVERVMQFSFGQSIIAATDLTAWHDMMAKRASSQLILAEFAPAFAQYLRNHGAAYPIEEHSHA